MRIDEPFGSSGGLHLASHIQATSHDGLVHFPLNIVLPVLHYPLAGQEVFIFMVSFVAFTLRICFDQMRCTQW